MTAADPPPFPTRPDPPSDRASDSPSDADEREKQRDEDAPSADRIETPREPPRDPERPPPPRPGIPTPRPSASSWRPTQSRPWDAAHAAEKDKVPPSERPASDRQDPPRRPDPFESLRRDDPPRSPGETLRPDPPAARPTIPGDPTGAVRPSPAAVPPARPDAFRRDSEPRTRPLPTVPSTAPRPSVGDPTTGVRPSDPDRTSVDPAPRPSADPGTFRHPGAALSRTPETPTRPLTDPARVEPRLPGPATVPLAKVPGSTPTRPEPEVARPDGTKPHVEREPERAHVVSTHEPAASMREASRSVVRIPVRSTFRVAVVFNVLLLVLWLVIGSFLFLVLRNTGVVKNIESFYAELMGYENVKFQFTQALLIFTVAGLVWVVLASIWTAFLAFVYNRASRLVGGIKLIVTDDDAPKR